MKKIIVTEKISDKGVALLKAQKDFQVDVEMDLSREELLKRIPEYDAIIVRSVTKINEEFYEHATNLKVVGRAGNGVDNIQMEGATKRGIIVVNTPESNIVSACEHTIGLLLASCRNTVKAHKMIESRVWNRDGLKGMELLGKTLGIVLFPFRIADGGYRYRQQLHMVQPGRNRQQQSRIHTAAESYDHISHLFQYLF